MIKHASPGRSLNALVTAGVKSKSNTIRSCCASLLIKLIKRIDPINVINSADFPRFVKSLLLFAKDANVTVRQTGKYGIRLLSKDNDLFDDVVRKSLNESERQNLHDVLESINRRGLEESNLASSTISLGSISRSGSIRRSGNNGRNTPISQGVQQNLIKIRNNLISSDWEQRMKGLKEFSEIIMRNDRAVILDTKVLNAFVGRTSDINFKVSVEAMETLITILPKLSSHFSKETSLKTVLYQLINSLMSHLASRSEGHRQHAKLCVEEIIKYTENVAILASFAAATKQANVKQKPFMLHTLSKLMESVYSIKPRQVETTGLPVLWELLRIPSRSCSDPEVRDAIRNYANTLARCFGAKTLLELSTFHTSPSQKKMNVHEHAFDLFLLRRFSIVQHSNDLSMVKTNEEQTEVLDLSVMETNQEQTEALDLSIPKVNIKKAADRCNISIQDEENESIKLSGVMNDEQNEPSNLPISEADEEGKRKKRSEK
ncbi:hypothetical protein DINM_003019 [Dirofilaria immitis]|nr:hypothetical protein [Dirofilaria immitis]